MNDQAPLYCREELPLPLRLIAALVVLLLLLPYHPLTWIATAQAGPHAGYCHMSNGTCTCAHNGPTDAPAHEGLATHNANVHNANVHNANVHNANVHNANVHNANVHNANVHNAMPSGAEPLGRADTTASIPPCHADEADEQPAPLLEGTGITPPATHMCGCGHDADDLTSAVAIDRFVLHGVSGTSGPPAPDAPTAVAAAAHLQPMAVDIFRPPLPVR